MFGNILSRVEFILEDRDTHGTRRIFGKPSAARVDMADGKEAWAGWGCDDGISGGVMLRDGVWLGLVP